MAMQGSIDMHDQEKQKKWNADTLNIKISMKTPRSKLCICDKQLIEKSIKN